MDRRMIRPSVRRCLFGRPTNADEFVQTQKRLEGQEEERFKRRWNLDGVENDIEWTKADSDSIPEFYLKGYLHKCRRRATRPCVGKSLSFADSDHEDSMIEDVSVRPASPVQYYGATSATVEVFIGLPHQPPQELHTPKKSDSGLGGDSHTSKSRTTTSDSDVVPNFTSQFLRKNTKQRRLTDMWRVLKRRQRSLSSVQPHHKRARIGRL